MGVVGFTYGGVHSSVFGIVCDPTPRVIFPEKRRAITDIAGRSGHYAQTDGTYLIRRESIHCFFKPPIGKTVPELAREIAAWLASDARLEFDNEPGKYYDAYVSGSLPQEQHLRYGEFDITFTYTPPFAYTDTKEERATVSASGGTVVTEMEGTVDTPCRIIIRNTGSTIIRNFRISRRLE
ncbi:MAG: phage tail family protein [Oscillospiraceae bacterium]|nr:phage tail family protein [Oscillospiraceae bacterium]